ncbi:MAG: hypothetical protein WC383_11710 [Gammaproteobacteria bacterium]
MDTVQFLLHKYGTMQLEIPQLREVLKYKSDKALLNAISAGQCPVPTYLITGRRRVADVRAVAKYLDDQHARAVAEYKAQQERLGS